MNNPAPPDAMLLLAPGCRYCPSVLRSLSELVKRGTLGRLEVVNMEVHPEVAKELGTRSVPWTRIGPFELDGQQTITELEEWIGHAAAGTGFRPYYSKLLQEQHLGKALQTIRQRPSTFTELVELIDDQDTPMTVRLGIGALFEELQGSPLLQPVLPALAALTSAESASTRADACHYLGLSENPDALPFIAPLLEDESTEVREIALESMALIRNHPMSREAES